MVDSVADWLAQLDLAQYARAFTDNDIEPHVLADLTDADLRELGVRSLGHRKTLLQAIHALQPAAPAASGRKDSPEAERRQLTVMFCDLADSTELSQQLDPEDLREVNRAYQGACTQAIEASGGYIARYMGDGVLAYFGYPMAHEDDAERAIRAGLRVVAAVRELDTALQLAVRVGIATGEVVVGDLIGEGAAQESAVVGETPNLAARLQGVAERNAVVIAPSTRNLAGRVFDYQDLGEQVLKGIVNSVPAFRVIGQSGVESRFEALRGGQPGALVGRDEELELLLSRWRRTADNEGQLVMLCGEPGIGKSRITEALVNSVNVGADHLVRYFCAPHATNSALYPLISRLERAAAVQRDDAPGVRLDKVAASLERSGDNSGETLALLAALLSIAPDERCASLDLTPQAQKLRTFEALLQQLDRLSTTGQVLLVLEDAHWLDPTTTEFFGMLIARMQTRPLMLLITHRPEFVSPWQDAGAPLTSLTLNRLGRRQVTEIVAQVVQDRALPDELLTQILARTDGVPLFVEELTKAVLESDAAAGNSAAVIPATLHDSLMYRLDRQAGAREVALMGSVIGREFDHPLLTAIAMQPAAQIETALDRLVGSGLVFRRGEPPEASYVFKHALVQDAAYQTLLKSRKRELHARIGAVIEEQFPQRAETEPERLAGHFTAAGETGKAIHYWMAAGLKALLGWSLSESVAHYTKALELLSGIEDDAARAEREIDVRTALGAATMALYGWPAPQMREAVEPACNLFEQGHGSSAAFMNFWNLWLHHGCRAEHREGLAVVERMLKHARERGTPELKLVSSFTAAMAYYWVGDYQNTEVHERSTFDLYDFDRDRGLVWTHNHDPKNTLLSWASNRVWALGFPDRARALSDEAVAHARRCGHAFNLCWTLGNSAIPYGYCGNYQQALLRIEELRSISREQELLFMEAYMAPSAHCVAAVRRDKYELAYEQAAQAEQIWQSVGGRFWSPMKKACIAQACIHLDRIDEATTVIEAAVADVEASGEFMVAEEIYRVAGLVRHARGDHQGAETCFNKSLEYSRAHATRSFELRTCMSLARLWNERGERQAAYDLLSPVYEWFTEGFDTADLEDAKTLLEQLA